MVTVQWVQIVLCCATQDYETATAALQFAATDFKAERAWKHYAGTQVPRMSYHHPFVVSDSAPQQA